MNIEERGLNYEDRRLRTFVNWPGNAVVDPKRIAQAGFYYTGRDLVVKCFSCDCTISEWNYGDKVMTKHRTLKPNCLFVRNPTDSGNVPIECTPGGTGSSNSSVNEPESETPPIPARLPHRESAIPQQPRSSPLSYLHSENARLDTFNDWPKPFIVTPESLARAGFYYTHQSDKVRCAYCGGMVSHWEAGDEPEIEHERHFPDCDYIQVVRSREQFEDNFVVDPDLGPGGITMRCPTSSGQDTEATMRELGVQSHSTPKHPKYSMYEARLQTYVNWPGDVSQTPEDLSDAGFYYAGSGDQVRCFHCDGGLRLWDPNDDPWVEHARWFPHCGYIVLVKGQTFVDEALTLHPPLDENEIAEFERVSMSKMDHVIPPTTRTRVPVTESQLMELMSSPAASAALQLGLEISRVKVALRQRAASGAPPFESAQALINAALDVQLEEAPDDDMRETWSTPPNTPVPLGAGPTQQSQQAESTSEEESDPDSDIENESLPRKRHHGSSAADDEKSDDSDKQGKGAIKSILAIFSRESSKAPGSSSPDSPSPSPVDDKKVIQALEEENRRLKEARLCKICMDKEICVVFLPCGHLVTCVQCAHSIADCPVCRKVIKATVRTFLS